MERWEITNVFSTAETGVQFDNIILNLLHHLLLRAWNREAQVLLLDEDFFVDSLRLEDQVIVQTQLRHLLLPEVFSPVDHLCLVVHPVNHNDLGHWLGLYHCPEKISCLRSSVATAGLMTAVSMAMALRAMRNIHLMNSHISQDFEVVLEMRVISTLIVLGVVRGAQEFRDMMCLVMTVTTAMMRTHFHPKRYNLQSLVLNKTSFPQPLNQSVGHFIVHPQAWARNSFASLN
jgi:hypothetical protein